MVVAEEASFQALGSLLIPFLIIHTIVHKTASQMKRRSLEVTRPLLAKWGPSGVGLACVPLMPVLVDEPCEHFVQHVFSRYLHSSPVETQEFQAVHKQSMQLSRLRSHIASWKSE